MKYTMTLRPARPVDRRKPNVLRYYDRERGLYVVTQGVASTGQISPKGTVSHTEHKADSGRCDAEARVMPVRAHITPEGEIINNAR